MKKQIDPKQFGLAPRTKLYQKDTNIFIISIDRKSRIIMKDATAILEKALKIKRVLESAVVYLETSAPVCSKSVAFLNEQGIEIIEL